MGIDATFASQLLALIANGTTIPNIAINATSSPLTNLYWALHSADPSGGNQTTNELAYTSYARVAAARTSSGLVVFETRIQPAADFSFPTPTGAAGSIAAFVSLGRASTGAGGILWSGALSPPIEIAVGNPVIINGSPSIVVV